MPTHLVSVVVATHARPRMLDRLLASLVDQRDDPVPVVVVDDASGDGTSDVLADWADRRPAQLRALATDRTRGPAVARNLGWRATDTEWVAFTDDDCEATPGWLTALLETAERTGASLVQGRTLPHPAEQHHRAPWSKSQQVEAFNHRFQACNLLLSRDLLEALDGFDESFPFAGEDADLGWRARRLGASMAFAEDAVVHHAVWPRTFAGYLRERRVWAELVRVVARHPGIRRELFLRLFFRRGHVAVVVGVPVVLGAAATVGWWVAPAAVATYVAGRTWRTRHTGWSVPVRLVWSGQWLVANAWEAGQFIRASIRYRTLVL